METQRTIIHKEFLKSKRVKSIVLDPYLETADIDLSNNYWGENTNPTQFELFKSGQSTSRRRNQSSSRGQNPMQKAKSKKSTE